MTAKYVAVPMMPQTRQRVLAALPTDGDGLTLVEVAKALRCCVRSASGNLYRLHELELVEKIRVPRPGGGRLFRWRAIPEGYRAPLYDPQPGWNIRPLAECFNGYTFTNITPTGGTCYGQFCE